MTGLETDYTLFIKHSGSLNEAGTLVLKSEQPDVTVELTPGITRLGEVFADERNLKNLYTITIKSPSSELLEAIVTTTAERNAGLIAHGLEKQTPLVSYQHTTDNTLVLASESMQSIARTIVVSRIDGKELDRNGNYSPLSRMLLEELQRANISITEANKQPARFISRPKDPTSIAPEDINTRKGGEHSI